MRIITANLKSISPYSQSRNYEMDVPKGEKETHADYRKRTWREHLHTTDDGRVFIPGMSFKNCLSEAAKYLSIQIPGKGKATYTKHVEAGVLVVDNIILSVKKDDVPGEWLHLPADGKRGSGKRIWKCYPVIREWAGSVAFHVVDDTVTLDVLKYHLEQAGSFIGIGRFRPRNNGYYGRFAVQSVKED